jgi:predicted nucleotidyltransferase
MTSGDIEREIVGRLRDLKPQLVILFGSRATGAAREDSDYDLLVVRDLTDPDAFRTPPVRAALGSLPAAFDIIVYTREEWESWREHPLSLAHHIRRTGRVLYAA